ncbi:hypothetical protein CGLO_14098 [Colletotrichum gloeosporioides Cg-14]|uniref:Uncharacterized protein n=1 Tax=Colletotrichum gloeosporioides (strain Cg-14) TaxID=1237896 RepID=T0K4I6_COLGC|nr:hypothetical protein CGLO_14098 [Colletotrichum gloeosporioides Cg-14]
MSVVNLKKVYQFLHTLHNQMVV